MYPAKKICVIVPIRNVYPEFKSCLESLSDLNYNNFDIIVVNDNEVSEFKIDLDIQDKNKIKILYSSGKGPSYARNLAAKSTDADFLAFTDSDCIVDKNWLIELFRGFEEKPYAVACGGIQKSPTDATSFEKKVFLFMQRVGFITDYIRLSGREDILEVAHNASCCALYKKDIFLKEGGFLEGLWPGEDVELDCRLRKKGYKLVFNPAAIVYHHRPKNLKSFSRMMYKYGEAIGILTKMYGFFRKIQILPLLFIFSIVLFALTFLSNFLIPILMAAGIILFIFLAYVRFDLYIFFLCCTAFLLWNIGFMGSIIAKNKPVK